MFTGLLIALLAIVGAATVVSGGLVVLARRTERQLLGADAPRQLTAAAGDGDPGVERTVAELRVGDIVQRDGRDFLVEGVVEYDEDGHRWRAGRVVDGRDEAWLVVGLERGGTHSLRWVVEDASVELSGHPPDKIVAGDRTYSQRSRGAATARVAGAVGGLANPASDAASLPRCRWWQYEAAGPGTMLVEQWGTRYRVLRGDTLRSGDVELMQGS